MFVCFSSGEASEHALFFMLFHQYMPKACVIFYISPCLLILKMCKLRAKTCYDYYWWVYLFRGVISFLFPIVFISNIVKCKFIHVNVCFDWFCLFCLCQLLFLFISIRCRHQIYLFFANSWCHVHLFFVYFVDLVLTYCTGNKHSSSLLDFLMLDKWLCFVVYFMFRFSLSICSSVIWFLLSVVRL